MAAFIPKGLCGLQRHRLRVGLNRIRNTVFPLDAVRIQYKLFSCSVIKHGHLVGAYDHESLLLERMKPTYKDVRPDSTGKGKLAECDVCHVIIKEVSALASHRCGFLAQKPEHHANI